MAVALNLAILPFALFRLGPGSLGVAGLVTASIAPALVFSNSLALSTARELARRLAPTDLKDAQRLFATAVALAVGLGGAIAVFFCLAGAPLARIAFHLSGPLADDLGLAFVFTGCGWLCQCVSAVFLTLFSARQDYRRIACISIISTVCTTAAMLILIPLAPRASTFLGCQASGFAMSLFLTLAWSRHSLGEWLARPAFHRDALHRLVRLGGWQLAAQGGALLAAQADRYLLGALLLPQFVGFYTVAQRLQEAMYIGVLKVGETLFPFFSSLHQETEDRKIDLLLRSSWILNVLAASALGGLIPVAGPLLHLWTGAEVAAEAQQVLVVLCVAAILGSSVNVFAFYLLAQGRSRDTALISLVTGTFTLATSAIALPLFGWRAAGCSTCVGMLAQIALTVFLLKRSSSLAGMGTRVFHLVLMPLGLGIVTALLLRYGLDCAKPDLVAAWWSVGSVASLSAAAILVVAVAASQLGPYGALCRRDLRAIVARFAPFGAV